MSAVLFSVIVPTFNRTTELARCLQAISLCSFDRERLEVIVVNDGGASPDDELAGAKKSGINVRLLTQPNRGPAAARNYGASTAQGQFLAFVDDDCIPAPNWLERLEKSVTQHPRALHGGRTINRLQDNRCSQASQSLVDYVYEYYNDELSGRTRFFASNNIAVASHLFTQAGGFDESLRAAEDRDFCRTWHKLGRRFQYVPEAIVNHAHHLTLRTLQKQHFNYGRGALPYWRKASSNGASRIKVEPLSFYAGMLTHPFTQQVQRPALISALIVVSQLANAMGFAFEAFKTRGKAGAMAESTSEAPARI